MSFFKETKMKVGGSYPMNKIRIALCKNNSSSIVLGLFNQLVTDGFIELSSKNGLHTNFDFYKILKEWTISE